MKAKHLSITAALALALGLSLALALTLMASRDIQADSRVLYVDHDALGPVHDGLSWTTAFTELQAALGVAVSGDEIWVAGGIYYPDYDPGSGQYTGYFTATFQLKTDIVLYGGFAATETLRAQRNWMVNVTVLSGDIDRNDFTDPNGVVTTTAHITGTNACHVIISNGVTQTSVLDGLTITAGQADGPYPDSYGGGMYNANSSPMLLNVTLSGNSASIDGGGMYNYYSSPTLVNVVFSGNSAGSDGGGVHNDRGSPTLMNVTFSGNSTGNYGGGMYNTNNSPMLTDVTFAGNSAGLYGGGMYNNFSSNPTLTNVTFSGNSAGFHGGGMLNLESSSPTLTNVAFSGNSATHDGGGMYNGNSSPTLVNVTFSGNSADYGGGVSNEFGSSPVLTNCILWGNTASSSGAQVYNTSSTPTVSYSDIQDSGGSGVGWDSSLGTDGGHNLDADPLFIDADGTDDVSGTLDDNLRLLLPDSPAIDVGDNTALPSNVTIDLDGYPRIVGTAVDMGPYEAGYRVYLPTAANNAP